MSTERAWVRLTIADQLILLMMEVRFSQQARANGVPDPLYPARRYRASVRQDSGRAS